jgi:hypothetical protein
MEKIEELAKLIAALNEDGEKFYDKGNKAAGSRLRKDLQVIRVKTQELRKAILDKSKKK